MKHSLLLAFLALTACTQSSASAGANLIGTHDLVFVDQLETDGTVARIDFTDAPNDDFSIAGVNGMPSRFLYVTSADTSELRVLAMFTQNVSGRGFVRAPNPLETLSIPVLERPTLLAADEGRNRNGQRVTGNYVYAARPGGSQVSIVGVKANRQLGGRPVPVPAPVSAIGAAMQIGADQQLPATTQLYVATWDGSVSSLYRATLDTNASVVDAQVRDGKVAFTRVTLLQGTPIGAMQLVAPLASRTNDGAPFCAIEFCVALATRATSTVAASSVLFEPSTGKSVALKFPGPIRKFAVGGVTGRIYGLLDEAACGGLQCGGVVSVDLVTSLGGFPRSKDALGHDFGPLRVSAGLPTGIAIGQNAQVQQTTEDTVDGGPISFVAQRYDELGAVASSDGFITYFSGLAGSVIDFDARRAGVATAFIRTPGTLPDGGSSFVTEDGGTLGGLVSATVDTPRVIANTYRVSTVTPPDQGEEAAWVLDISDGAFSTQELVVANQGQIPGLVSLPTSITDGVRLATGGAESRVLVSDGVIFETGNDTDGYVECGRGVVSMIGGGFIEVYAVPAGCDARVRFTVRAGTSKPLVIAGAVEGYMGRVNPGEVFHYDRPLVIIPAEVTTARTSLTLTTPRVVPVGEGAFINFNLQSYISPLSVQIDTASGGTMIKCSSQLTSQVVFGNLVMLLGPYNANSQSEVGFNWGTFAVVPSGNAVAEINQGFTRAGGTALTNTDNAACYR